MAVAVAGRNHIELGVFWCDFQSVPDSILPNLVDIVKQTQTGDAIKANEAYLLLAIGNAAWPIGRLILGSMYTCLQV